MVLVKEDDVCVIAEYRDEEVRDILLRMSVTLPENEEEKAFISVSTREKLSDIELARAEETTFRELDTLEMYPDKEVTLPAKEDDMSFMEE
jgi:hypothetical protein